MFVSFGCADEHGSRDGTERALTTSSPASSQTPAAAPPTAPKKPNNSGVGCVPIHNLMEDAATAEISRAQIWQWIHHPTGVLDDGRKVTVELYRQITGEELAKLRKQLGEAAYAAGNYERAAKILDEITTADAFETFLTLPAYRAID